MTADIIEANNDIILSWTIPRPPTHFTSSTNNSTDKIDVINIVNKSE